MLKLVGNKIYLTRGDTANFKVIIRAANREEYTPKETDKVVMTVKKTTGDKEIAFQKTIKDGLLAVEPSDTSELAYGDYVYDCQLETESGIVQTFIPPTLFRVMEEVTY